MGSADARFVRVVVAAIACVSPLGAAHDQVPVEHPVVLRPAAADLPITHGGRSTTGGAVDSKLSPPLRRALNDWAELATDLHLSVVVPETAEALLLGTADGMVLQEAGAVMDKTWELFADLHRADQEPLSQEAVVAFLFDEDGFHSELWDKLLDAPKALLSDSAAGTSTSAQLVAWGTLDYLHSKAPETLADMLSKLGGLHEAASHGRAGPDYAGDDVQTAEVIGAAVAGVAPRDVISHLKRVK